MKQIALFLEDILKIIGASSIMLIIFGYLDLRSYYNNFGVNINNYLSTSEILLQSIDKIGVLLIVVFFQIIIWLTLFNHLFDHNLDGPYKLKDGFDGLFTSETVGRMGGNKTIKIVLISSVAGMIISILSKIFFRTTNLLMTITDFFLINFLVTFLIYAGLLQSTKLFWDKMKNVKEYSGKVIVTFSLSLIVIIFSIWFKNLMNKNRIIKYSSLNSIELTLNNDKQIKASDSVAYLGKTSGFYFFLNKVSKQVNIYPASEVKLISQDYK